MIAASRFLQPLQMIASLPLELAGVFTALWLAHQAFSTVSIMAVIVLTGMESERLVVEEQHRRELLGAP